MNRKKGHVPIRLCAGCGARDARAAMARFTVVQGRLVCDRHAGRGAYLHPREECRQAFLARKPWIRSLRISVARSERTRFLAEGVK